MEGSTIHTFVRVEDANCSWRINAVRAELLARPLVRRVRMSATAGCFEVTTNPTLFSECAWDSPLTVPSEDSRE